RARTPAIENLRCHLGHVRRCAPAFAFPIGARGERRVRRIGVGLEAGNAALMERVTPIRIEIGLERLQARHRRGPVPIHGSGRSHVHHSSALIFAALAIAAQLAISQRVQASSSAGVLPLASMPRFLALSENSSEATAARMSTESFCRIGPGMPAGPYIAFI